MSKVNISEVAVGDVFSEEAHYRYLGFDPTSGKHKVEHLATKNEVTLTEKYISDLLVTADQFEKEIKVGKEDKYWTVKQIEEAKKKGELAKDSTVREGD